MTEKKFNGYKSQFELQFYFPIFINKIIKKKLQVYIMVLIYIVYKFNYIILLTLNFLIQKLKKKNIKTFYKVMQAQS